MAESKTELLIHGHSCLEIRTQKSSLICDPWLLGSTYWRSWWNFPEPPDLDSLLEIWNAKENLYIYITHLHWDHFHGPTLRKIKNSCKNVRFILPKTPEERLKLDLENIVRNNIYEIEHAKYLNLTDDLSILSFQFGPFLTDSTLLISTSDFNILNMNDAKILELSLSNLLSIIPKPNIVLRSHSSANTRCCFRNYEGKVSKIKFDKARIDYSKEFFDSCYKTGAEIAIPFASNMACLHKETFQYNSILNFSDYVLEDFKSVSSEYIGMDCKLLLPSESLILETSNHIKNFSLREKLKKESREIYLRKYQERVSKTLAKQYKLEDSTKISYNSISKYFKKIINSTPYLLKRYLNNKIILEIYSNVETKMFNIDFCRGTLKEIYYFPKGTNYSKIRVSAFVINDICKKSHWNSIGVSKRLEIFANPKDRRYVVFNYLCNTIESGGFLPLKNIFKFRFLSIWFKRYIEILDWILFAIKLIINKSQGFF